MTLKRVWHPCDQWEEIQHNMWGEVDDRQASLSMAVSFTGNHYLYGHFMMRVIKEWPVSCENALTDNSLNKRAWIGHAACALAFGCPEDIVRQAWSVLSDEQRALANKQADRAIGSWEENYRKSQSLYPDLDREVLP